MEKIEILKTLCEMYKSFALAFITALFALVAYFIINLYTLKSWQIGLIIAGLIVLSVFIFTLLKLLFDLDKKLKKELKQWK